MLSVVTIIDCTLKISFFLTLEIPIKVLIPDKAVKKTNYSFDRKFISCVMEIDTPIAQIGGGNNRYHVISCVIKSCPNRKP